MTIDWNVVATIAAPIVALFVGAWVNTKFENRPKLISYFSHVSNFTLQPNSPSTQKINIHSVVLRNTGRRPALNVRLHHNVLPNFNIYPSLVHHTEILPDGTSDILIPTLVPGEEITITYLYTLPIIFESIHAGVKFDQGMAKQITVLLQQQLPSWLRRSIITVFFLGIISIFYVLYSFISKIYS